MEIRIGMTNTGRELSFEIEESAEAVSGRVADALDGKASHVAFTDAKGRTYLVSASDLAYVEIGTDQTRRVGFVA
ncbi:DUF3107 domain-containing protein [Microbacterium sp. gxy059]|uniref:DUF3107 domain-containing protein n=1 Tax=Microbacterium sp. gxy059 TaxID=2957199 RepID=UPI003D9750CB